MGTQNSTEPSASTIDWKPRKSTTMKWSTKMPVFPLRVRMTHAGPPALKLAFQIRSGPPATVLFGSLQSRGALVIESRGMLTTTADFRSPDRCRSSVVSDPPPGVVPNSVVPRSRLSEPITRMLSGLRLVTLSALALLLGRLPRFLVISSLVMLLLSLR